MDISANLQGVPKNGPPGLFWR